jgi:hypothetical protein
VLTLPGGYHAEFTPDGTRVIVAAKEPAGRTLVSETVRVYLVHLEDLVAFARSRLTRGLTPAECNQYLRMEVCP